MEKMRPPLRRFAFVLSLVLLFSFLTVEVYASSSCPWLQLPGFMESDTDFAPPGFSPVAPGADGVAEYCAPAPALTLPCLAVSFLNIYRAPPL